MRKEAGVEFLGQRRPGKKEIQGPSLRGMRVASAAPGVFILVAGMAYIAGLGADPARVLILAAPLLVPYAVILWRLRGGVERKGIRLAMSMGSMGLVVIAVPALFAGGLLAFMLVTEGMQAIPDEVLRALTAWLLFFGILAGLQAALLAKAKTTYEAQWLDEGRQKWLAWNAASAAFALLAVALTLAVTVPDMIRSRMATSEASPVGSLKAIHSAAEGYAATYYNEFPPSLRTLGPPQPGMKASCQFADLIDSVLADGTKSGYGFEYKPGLAVKQAAAGCPPGADSFTVSARPITYGTTGQRSFFMDKTGIIHATTQDRAATKEDPRID